jgi:predicted dehydrogenase
VADFVRAIVARKSVAPTFADGLATQRVLAAIEQSARQKKWVRCQP